MRRAKSAAYSEEMIPSASPQITRVSALIRWIRLSSPRSEIGHQNFDATPKFAWNSQVRHRAAEVSGPMLRETDPALIERNPMKPRRLAVFGLTAGLLGGGAAGLLMTGTTLAGAQTADPNTTTTAPATPAPAADETPKREWAKSALDGLVAKGTITQAQADEVLAALKAARPDKPRAFGFGKLDAAASALGMTVEELRTALQGGQSLAAVAKAKGIDVAKVVEALVAQMKTHLDQHVASGTHTQAEADQMLAAARARIQAFVNGEAPAGKPGLGFGRGGRGHGPKPGAPANGTAPSGTSSSGDTITS
jgi:hypothetical protein